MPAFDRYDIAAEIIDSVSNQFIYSYRIWGFYNNLNIDAIILINSTLIVESGPRIVYNDIDK